MQHAFPYLNLKAQFLQRTSPTQCSTFFETFVEYFVFKEIRQRLAGYFSGI